MTATWERFDRRTSGACVSMHTVWASVFTQGIRLNAKAKDEFIGNNRFVELYVDKQARKIAFKPLMEPSFNAYKICWQGDLKRGYSTCFISCRSVVTAIGIKGYFSLVRVGDLIELVPFEETESK